ncbi:MAG: hypothetical protein DLM57_05055 [Pseudonocardiales bacterium]|nr:MAG: hypothetical protein DLM57_05055 [Pseudonocardiales bacterium]
MTRSGRGDADRRAGGRISAADVRLHALLVVGVPICIAAGWFELTRALAGREVAWVYTFEWPLFGIYGVYIWWRLYRERKSSTARPSNSIGEERSAGPDVTPVGLRASANERTDVDQATDPQLAAWEQYLSALHSVDPPGGPPGTNR